MKINNSKGVGVTANFEPVSHDFGIGDPAMVIEILRKRLYSNPIQTLVQEYVSNARDACREAGLPERLVITVPSANNAVFKVRDYGCGISPDRIANVFVNYCSSTKRADDKQTGGFGIGAKSAWAYTDSFTVISYLDGTARHYVAHLGAKNSGSMDLISETATPEPNGTEIQVGVQAYDVDAFTRAVYRCTYFWETRPELRGIALIDIPDWYKAPKSVAKIGDVSFHTSEQLGSGSIAHTDLILVVDGIPYPVHNLNLSDVLDFDCDLRCALRVPTGTVEVGASRESLSDSKENHERLAALYTEAAASIQSQFNKELKAAKTLGEFIKTYGRYHDLGVLDQMRYEYAKQYSIIKGTLSGTAGVESVALRLEKVRNKESNKTRLEAQDKVWTNLHDYQLLYVDKECGKAVVYAKVRQHLMSLPEGVKKQAIVFSQGAGGLCAEFAKDVGALPLSSIELVNKISNAEKKPASVITVHTYNDPTRYGRRGRGHDGVTIDLAQNSEKYVYVVKDSEPETFTEQKKHYKKLAGVLTSKTTLKFCFVSLSTHKKIENDPNFITPETFWQSPLQYLTSDTIKTLANDVYYEAISDLDYGIRSLLSNRAFVLRLNQIQDAKLVSSIRLIKSLKEDDNYYYRNNNSEVWEQIRKKYLDENSDVKRQAKEYKTATKAFAHYPLMRHAKTDHMDDLILYLNAKYQELKRGQD